MCLGRLHDDTRQTAISRPACECVRVTPLTAVNVCPPQAVLDGEELSLPWRSGGLQVNGHSGLSLVVRSDHGYLLLFTPQKNEFTLTLLGSSAGSRTAGLCGTPHSLLLSAPSYQYTGTACRD